MILGQRLKELRAEHKILQKDLAAVLNVRNTTVSAWETGDNEPDLQTLIKIASYFNVSTDYLLGYEAEDGTRITEELTIKSINDIKLTRRK